jgi:hypothetical protein
MAERQVRVTVEEIVTNYRKPCVCPVDVNSRGRGGNFLTVTHDEGCEVHGRGADPEGWEKDHGEEAHVVSMGEQIRSSAPLLREFVERDGSSDELAALDVLLSALKVLSAEVMCTEEVRS